MDKAEGWRVIDEQRGVVADLLDTLTPGEWATPSLCDGWTVREVAAHLTMAALTPTADALRAAWRARGSFDRIMHDTAVERGRRPTEQIVADLRSTVGRRRLAPFTVWRDPLIDLVVHGQDIARPLGRVVTPPLGAVRTSADWAWQRWFPFFAARRLHGLRLVADDVAWSRGQGAVVRGPILSLLLLSTGRPAGLADVSGPGLELAGARLARHTPV